MLNGFVSLLWLAVILSVATLPSPAHAYIGPGLGLGAIGMVLAVVFSVFLAALAIVWYPIKRIIRGSKNRTMTRELKEGAKLSPDD
jgi:hypothetical protein